MNLANETSPWQVW